VTVLVRPTLAVVVDSDVASFFVNDDPVRLPRYEPHLQSRGVIIPFAALAEMLFGAEIKNWGPLRRGDIDAFVRKGSVHYPNRRVCELWAESRTLAQRVGKPLPPQDAWVAATALYLGVPLVTHNARHYAGVPQLQVITEPDTGGS
jgi:predicted nucleic acid-binding protein